MKRYRQNPDVAGRTIDGSAVLIQPTTAEIRGLNTTGSRIWTLLETPRSLDELVQDLVERFQVDVETASRDAESFLTAMVAKDLVRIEEA